MDLQTNTSWVTTTPAFVFYLDI